MSQRCHRKGGMNCWQYKKDATAVPTWATEYVYLNGKKMEGQFPNNGDSFEMKDGDWLVVLSQRQEAVAHYTAEEFAKLFEEIL